MYSGGTMLYISERVINKEFHHKNFYLNNILSLIQNYIAELLILIFNLNPNSKMIEVCCFHLKIWITK